MKTLTLAGHQWHTRSPSLYVMAGIPLAVGFDGTSWLIAVDEVFGLREYPSRDDAMTFVAQALALAELENMA